MIRKPLEHSIRPWTESDFGHSGFLLTIREPYTGQRGQGFFLEEDAAVRAWQCALHRYNSGANPLEYLDTPFATVP